MVVTKYNYDIVLDQWVHSVVISNDNDFCGTLSRDAYFCKSFKTEVEAISYDKYINGILDAIDERS